MQNIFDKFRDYCVLEDLFLLVIAGILYKLTQHQELVYDDVTVNFMYGIFFISASHHYPPLCS